MYQFCCQAISLRALRAMARDRVQRQQPFEIFVIMSPQGSLLASEFLEIPNSIPLSISLKVVIGVELSQSHV
jgi:hypothetical protein